MPDDHSKVVPLLPIPNRKVKRFSADESADSRVKVGHRQASILEKPSVKTEGFFSSVEMPKLMKLLKRSQKIAKDRCKNWLELI